MIKITKVTRNTKKNLFRVKKLLLFSICLLKRLNIFQNDNIKLRIVYVLTNNQLFNLKLVLYIV